MRRLAPVLLLLLSACSFRDLDDLAAGNGGPECVAPSSDPDVAQALPRQYLDTSYPDESGLRVVRVGAGGDLQAVLDAAHGGELILLAAGASYGPVTFAGGGSEWTVLRTDEDTLPPAGTKPVPGAKLAKLVGGADGTPALRTVENARLFRVVDVALAAHPDATGGAVVELGPSDLDPMHLPRNVLLDRVTISGGATCLRLNGAFAAIVDSTLSKCDRGVEIVAGGGPYRVAGVAVTTTGGSALLVGGDPRPADVEVARSRFARPEPSGADPGVIGVGDVDRLLFACNVVDASTANAFELVGGARDVTIAYDRARGASALRVVGTPERVVFVHDLFEDVPDMFRIDGTMKQSKIDHVTAIDWSGAHASAVEVNEPSGPLWVESTIFSATMYGIHGTNLGVGQATIDADLAPGRVVGNAFVAQSCSAYPAGNTCPTTVQSLGFESRTDPRLRADSALVKTGADGSNPGADVARIDELTGGVAP